MKHFIGTGASKGIAIGAAFIKKSNVSGFDKECIDDKEHEWDRFLKAKGTAGQQLQNLFEQSRQKIGEEEAKIFEAHLMILEDEELLNSIRTQIYDGCKNAEWAIHEAAEHFAMMLESLEDEYLKERASDIRDVALRVIGILSGCVEQSMPSVESPCILVAKDLLPGEMVNINASNVLGIITETGGKTSHTAILAKALGIPAVVGAAGIVDNVNEADTIILNGEDGNIYLEPEPEVLKAYKQKQMLINQQRMELEVYRNIEPVTKDGEAFEVFGNVTSVIELDGIIENGAQGIGLFRTEFLFTVKNTPPDENEQYEIYKLTAERMQGKPVIIRTLDIGGDKEVPYLGLAKEENPFLGCRGIRLCFEKLELWKIQVRALLRASIYGDIKIMLPMISVKEEIIKAKAIISEVKEELKQKGIPFNDNIEVGIMIETPAAAVIADLLAKEVDFFSIGTNDLIQYTLACDRMNSSVAHLYNQFNPSVLRLIKNVIDSAHANKIKVGMCGEAAGDVRLIPLFAGMGLDEFSMNASAILEAKKTITEVSQQEMSKRVTEVLKLGSSKEVEEYLNTIAT